LNKFKVLKGQLGSYGEVDGGAAFNEMRRRDDEHIMRR